MLPQGIIKAILELNRQGYTIIKIAKTLNLHVEEVVNAINDYQ